MGSLMEKSFPKVLRGNFVYGLRRLGYFWSWQHCSHGAGFTGLKNTRISGLWRLSRRLKKITEVKKCVEDLDSLQGSPERPCMKL